MGNSVLATAAPASHAPATQIAAEDITSIFNQAKPKNVNADSVPLIIGEVIKVVLSILGIVLLIILVYAGIVWMTAEGEKAKVEKARGMITTAIIGLIIVLSAYAITFFVVENVKRITGVQ